MVEQASVYPDLDGRDLEPTTRHVVLTEDDVVVGYLRLLDDGDAARIGRVVVAAAARGRGLADELMRAALAETGGRGRACWTPRPGWRGWYASYGFEVSGPEFVDDGIRHLPMRGRPASAAEGVRRPVGPVVPGDARRGRPAARGGPCVSSVARAALKTSRSPKALLVPGPAAAGRRPRTPCARPPATASRQQREPHVVVDEQLVDPGVRRRRHRAVRRQQRQVGQRRAPWSASRGSRPAAAAVGTGSKPIDGVIVGSTWSPANSSPAARSAKT